MEEETVKVNGNLLALFIIFFRNGTRKTVTAAQRIDKSKTDCPIVGPTNLE